MPPPPSMSSQIRASLPEWMVPADTSSNSSSNAGIVGALAATTVVIALSVAWLRKRNRSSSGKSASSSLQPEDSTSSVRVAPTTNARASSKPISSSSRSSKSPPLTPPTSERAVVPARAPASAKLAPDQLATLNLTSEQAAQLSKPAVDLLRTLYANCRVRQRTLFHDAVTSTEQYVSLLQGEPNVIVPVSQLLKCTTKAQGKVLVLLIGEPSRPVDLDALSAAFDAKKRKPFRPARPERVEEILRVPVAGSMRPLSPFSLLFDTKLEVVVIISKSLSQGPTGPAQPLAFPLLGHDATTVVSFAGLERFLSHIKHEPIIVDFDHLDAFKWQGGAGKSAVEPTESIAA